MQHYRLWCVEKGVIRYGQGKIFEMVIGEMTENALSCRRQNLEENEQRIYTEVGSLSSQVQDIVKELTEEKQKILFDYFEKTNMIDDHECAYLYVQGVKDCVKLLKKFGML